MHAVTCGVVPGDDERRFDVLYDERRHDDQLSGVDAVPYVEHVCGRLDELLL